LEGKDTLLLDTEKRQYARFVDFLSLSIARHCDKKTASQQRGFRQHMQCQGQRVLVLIWDNASWHVGREVHHWLQEHNQSVLTAERKGKPGVRIIPCWLPIKSPWLNRIEPHWMHGKRAIFEPARLLTAQEVIQRVCDYFGCKQLELLTQQAS
jgi:hypothetical protein